MSSLPKKRPILVVDDETDILHSLRSLLRRDFEVFTANSGAEAMKILENEVIHLVMTDQRMPQMTGVEFLTHVKTDHPEAMRLIFTGYADIRAVIDAINQGNVFRYVSKPWDPEELLAALKEAGEQYDRICERTKLLGDLKTHEEQCLMFEDKLRMAHDAGLSPEAVAELEHLYTTGRSLLIRLGSALSSPSRSAIL
jgi:DNA-binding NtrC family response regulator